MEVFDYRGISRRRMNVSKVPPLIITCACTGANQGKEANPNLPENSLVSVIGVGASQWPIIATAISMGLHVRVGMEDNIYIEKGRLAESNAQLVKKVVDIANILGRPVATPSQAREMLGLPAQPRKY